ncbi:hypothetical protein PTTG_01085 [Puccinia triticina 1-1 BBBD Race 1]|uniref:Alpha-galactosidase n=1 Tax=Puccinia triticina (isolate 1-1 / race 1 (BBBD)) TaxID=630390 RepID=A0A180GY63_PUCT1|nr:hypothetical protein PTTG_01085 [Puccinia triticina 1-1 BBBD Race 1]WAR59282.1 hypothetical protein PtB15_10B624 [Puccinia triticina]
MNSCSNVYQLSCRLNWIGIAIFCFSSIGLTTQTPTRLLARDQAPVPRPKPVMGWNSFTPMGCTDINAEKLRAQADLLGSRRLLRAGYKTFIVECGWEQGVGDDGPAVAIYPDVVGGDVVAFREDFRRRGLLLGFGTWGGPQICTRNPDEDSHIKPRTDLDSYARGLDYAGVTYLSHRPCELVRPDIIQTPDKAMEVNSRYVQMDGAIINRDLQNKILYASGQWGATPEMDNSRAYSWRIADDTIDSWPSIIRTMNALVPYSIANRRPLNDLGFLQFGPNRLTPAEKKTQFAFWAAAKSPLIFSADIATLTEDEINLMTNPKAIAINQDDLGTSITLTRRYPADMDMWSGPLSDGSTVAVIVNWSDDSAQKTIQLDDLGFSSANVEDILNQKNVGPVTKSLITTIEKHGCLFIKLTDTKPAPKKTFTEFPIEVADITGVAQLKLNNRGVKVAVNLKADGVTGLRWSKIIGSKNGFTLVRLHYTNAELSPGNMDDSKLNFKHTAIVINDKFTYYADLPITGLTWDDMIEGFPIVLPLEPGVENTIFIRGENDQFAPDIHRLSVENTGSV